MSWLSADDTRKIARQHVLSVIGRERAAPAAATVFILAAGHWSIKWQIKHRTASAPVAIVVKSNPFSIVYGINI